jgi:uncharacterized protein (TIGR03086 family)
MSSDPGATDRTTDPRATLDPRTTLSRALDQAGLVVAHITPDQWTNPTPCRSWDVSAVANHLINGLDRFRTTASGEKADWSQPMSDVEGDWAVEFRKRADGLAAAWAAVPDIQASMSTGLGELPMSFVVYQQVAEIAQHTWDLATATGQRDGLDGEVAAEALDWAEKALKPEYRGSEESGKAFGDQRPIADDASTPDRLAAFFGRDVDFTGV